MTPTMPEGAPKPGEQYANFFGWNVCVVSVDYDPEKRDWYITHKMVSFGTRPVDESERLVSSLAKWNKPIPVGYELVPRYVKIP